MDAAQCFHILEVEPGADAETVKKAYRDLVSVWHPDRFAGNERLRRRAEEKVKDINAAYASLQAWFRKGGACGMTPGKKPAPSDGKEGGRRGRPAPTAEAKGNRGAGSATGAGPGGREASWEFAERRIAAMMRARKMAEERDRARKVEAERRRKQRAAIEAQRRRRERKRVEEIQRQREEKRRKEALAEERERVQRWASADARLAQAARARQEVERQARENAATGSIADGGGKLSWREALAEQARREREQQELAFYQERAEALARQKRWEQTEARLRMLMKQKIDSNADSYETNKQLRMPMWVRAHGKRLIGCGLIVAGCAAIRLFHAIVPLDWTHIAVLAAATTYLYVSRDQEPLR